MLRSSSKAIILFLLALFVLGKSFMLFHSFSHYNFSGKNNLSADKTSLSKFFGEHKKSQKNSDDCVLCSFANFQNQISISTGFFLAIAGFVLVFVSRFFSSVKLSFLLNSFSSRAPPVIS